MRRYSRRQSQGRAIRGLEHARRRQLRLWTGEEARSSASALATDKYRSPAMVGQTLPHPPIPHQSTMVDAGTDETTLREEASVVAPQRSSGTASSAGSRVREEQLEAWHRPSGLACVQ